MNAIINQTFEDFPELCQFVGNLCGILPENVDADIDYNKPADCPLELVDIQTGKPIEYRANGRAYRLYIMENSIGYDLSGAPMPQKQCSLV